MKDKTPARRSKAPAVGASDELKSDAADNNNDHDFDCKYVQAAAAGGPCEPKSHRLSPGGSGAESAGSLSSEDEEHQSGSDSGSSPSSGRSSASRPEPVPNEIELGNNSVPETPAACQLMEMVRVRLLELDSLDTFDPLDLEALRCPLVAAPGSSAPARPSAKLYQQSISVRYIARFLRFDHLLKNANQQLVDDSELLQKAVDEAAEKMRDLLQFRARYQLEHTIADQFSREFHMLHGIFPFGRDRNGLPVLYLRARVHRRWSHALNETFKRYVAWNIDQLTKSFHGASVAPGAIEGSSDIKDGSFGVYFDCLHVSYACVDMDFLGFLVKTLVHCYPTYCRYTLCIDLPWLFRSVWALVRSWLPEEAQKTVHLITSKQLCDFIDEDQIPNSMKQLDMPANKKSPRGKHRIPAPIDSYIDLDEMARELSLSSSELKHFKSHIDKLMKEYRQMGAV